MKTTLAKRSHLIKRLLMAWIWGGIAIILSILFTMDPSLIDRFWISYFWSAGVLVLLGWKIGLEDAEELREVIGNDKEDS